MKANAVTLKGRESDQKIMNKTEQGIQMSMFNDDISHLITKYEIMETYTNVRTSL
jgi:hypothetical protein